MGVFYLEQIGKIKPDELDLVVHNLNILLEKIHSFFSFNPDSKTFSGFEPQ